MVAFHFDAMTTFMLIGLQHWTEGEERFITFHVDEIERNERQNIFRVMITLEGEHCLITMQIALG